jgi:uncharacterized protein (DUF1800 family)
MRTPLPAALVLALIATSAATSTAATARRADREVIEHLLSRLTYGPTAEDRRHVEEIGIPAYIDEQLDPAAIDDSAFGKHLASLSTLRSASPSLMATFNPPKMKYTPSLLPDLLCTMPAPPLNIVKKPLTPTAVIVSELQQAALLRAVYSRRQLYERLVNFWENHFSININKERMYVTTFDRDVIRPFALGNFRALLGATAHSPAMLFYLDNWQSSAGGGAADGRPLRGGGSVNENYARELLELHTLGVDGGYTQRDVEEVARCFTGWSIYKVDEAGLFLFDPTRHDDGEKRVLGHRIPPGGGIADGEMVLDILAKHPSTARFIATKLARMFLSDDPPPSLVKRAAAVFLSSNGSIKETVRAILESREFASRGNYGKKMKSPFEYAASALRALNAQTDGGPALFDWIARMGESMFGHVTPEGYPDRSETWLSTGTLLERMNFAIALANNQIKGTRYKAENPKDAALLIGSPPFQLR